MREPNAPTIPRLHPVKLTVDQIALVQHLVMRHLLVSRASESQTTSEYSTSDRWRIACANVSLSQTLDKLLKQGESLAQHEQHAGNC